MKSKRFQFGIRRLIALTTAVAVVMAICVRIDASQFVKWVFAGYLTVFVAWAVMRGPNVFDKLREVREQRRKVEQSRDELKSEAGELRQASTTAKASESEHVPHDD